jgi:hypothetical protein
MATEKQSQVEVPAPTALSIAKALEEARQKVIALEKQQNELRLEKIKSLPADSGYESAIALVEALIPFCEGWKLVKAKAGQTSGTRRPNLTPEREVEIIEALKKNVAADKAVRKTGEQLAKELNVNPVTLAKIKNKAKLTKIK